MEIYKEYIRGCAPEYGTLTSRIEKTAYVSDLVTNFINNGFIFIQKDGDDYFLYNMETDEAFNKVREKVRQAMRDLLRNTTLPEISVLEFQNEGPLLPGRELMKVFDELQTEKILGNIVDSSEERETFELDEVKDEGMDEMTFSDFPMMD